MIAAAITSTASASRSIDQSGSTEAPGAAPTRKIAAARGASVIRSVVPAIVGIWTARERDLGPVIEHGRAGHGEEVQERLSETRLPGGIRSLAADEAWDVVVVDEYRARVLMARAQIDRKRRRRS